MPGTCYYIEKPLSTQPVPDYLHYLQAWYDHTGLEFSVTVINIKRNICQIREISILTGCAGPDRYEPSPSWDTCCRIKRDGLLSVTYAELTYYVSLRCPSVSQHKHNGEKVLHKPTSSKHRHNSTRDSLWSVQRRGQESTSKPVREGRN